ncbi:hypothetical protein GCM10022222_01390 [Amycolatopsis ultiminotia]|uniref:Uncharacterized protein n=1 Tax=Amycolatopsis ultiminotia TaxID=543629 RepID=A0ABP6UVW4_9PSEU
MYLLLVLAERVFGTEFGQVPRLPLLRAGRAAAGQPPPLTVFTRLTSTVGWDTGRATTNTVAISVLGRFIYGTGLSLIRHSDEGYGTLDMVGLPTLWCPQVCGAGKPV